MGLFDNLFGKKQENLGGGENIETELGTVAASLVAEVKQNNLTKSALRNLFQKTKSNFNDITLFSKIEDYKNVGTLFMLMLQIDDFEEDVEVQQSMTAIGYYFLSYAINNKTLDSYGVNRPDLLQEYIELLKIRLLLLLQSKDNIKYTIRLVPNRPVDKYYTPLMDDYNSERSSFMSMALSDAGEIRKIGSSPMFPLHQEAVKLASSVINDNPNLLRDTNIENKIVEGKKEHNLLYQYLDNRFRVKHSFNFNDEDDD